MTRPDVNIGAIFMNPAKADLILVRDQIQHPQNL